MTMLTLCASPGCPTMVFGSGFCVACEPTLARLFPRGRPLQSASAPLEGLDKPVHFAAAH